MDHGYYKIRDLMACSNKNNFNSCSRSGSASWLNRHASSYHPKNLSAEVLFLSSSWKAGLLKPVTQLPVTLVP